MAANVGTWQGNGSKTPKTGAGGSSNLQDFKGQGLLDHPRACAGLLAQNLPATCHTQVHLFKIGGIQSKHHRKKTRGVEPPPNSNWHPSSQDNSTFQTQCKPCTRLVGSSISTSSLEPDPAQTLHSPAVDRSMCSSGHHLKKIRGLEPSPNPNWHRCSLDKSRLNLTKHKHPEARASPNRTPPRSRQVPGQSRRVQRTNKKTGARSEFDRTLNP